jgi:hypothetical protein
MMRDSSSTISPNVNTQVKTGNDERMPIAGADPTDLWRKRWDEIIDRVLIEWGKDATGLADPDEGILAPTPQSIRTANRLAIWMRDHQLPPPGSVVPDGEGGVSFERSANNEFQSLDVHADCSIEMLTFRDCHLIARIRMSLE